MSLETEHEMIKTYLDSGVLIAAAKGTYDVALAAMIILDDDQRQFCSSQFVKLEILPKAKFHKQQWEVEFYESYFAKCLFWAAPSQELVNLAEDLGVRYGINGMDALGRISGLGE